MKNLNLEWLVCPVTHEPLSLGDNELISPKFKYKNEGGYWNFIPENLEELNTPLWKIWNQLQDNGVASYKNSPTNNLGVGPRKDFMQFADFCNFSGTILDVGVGPQEAPTHIQYNKKSDVTFIGLDPLAGDQPRGFTFVQGLGEYLPFKNDLFNQVLFVTSLDHFMDPVIALREAQRVVKKEGGVYVWLGEKDKSAPKPTVSPDWYKSLQIPEGAEDPFHYRRFSIADFRLFLEKTDLKIIKEEVHIVDVWRKNCFFKLSK